jgi:hypothetical protein
MAVIKKHQTIPGWVELEIQHASKTELMPIIFNLVNLGWTYESIAKARGISRERVRQLRKKAAGYRIASGDSGIQFPEPPSHLVKLKPSYIEPSPWVLEKLLELQPLAQKVRGSGSAYRKEAEEYTALINHAHMVEGVTLYRLAKRLGVTHGAIRFRLVRYGYITPKTGVSGVYKPVAMANRYGK